MSPGMNDSNTDTANSNGNSSRGGGGSGGTAAATPDKKSEMFIPLHISDFDKIDMSTMEYGQELDSEHPGFHDPAYRERRRLIVENAIKYRNGMELPDVLYTNEENEVWRICFAQLTKLYPSHACHEYLDCFEKLGFPSDRIPQLGEVTKKLFSLTGWRLKPVAGLLTPRQFLNSLAFKVFHATQYIRHPSRPLYTAEPDVIHELMGHAPLLADPEFARFSQVIGLASIGASDEEVDKLATCYWFSVEFGICREASGELRAYGAGLLSSFGELQYSLGTDKAHGTPEYRPFDPPVTALQKYPITQFQPLYFVAESFAKACDQMLEFSKTLTRSFNVEYHPDSDSITIVNSTAAAQSSV
eukprot:ANDGO_00744.mRNA.1 Protein henna